MNNKFCSTSIGAFLLPPSLNTPDFGLHVAAQLCYSARRESLMKLPAIIDWSFFTNFYNPGGTVPFEATGDAAHKFFRAYLEP